jgi:predicted PurR-regulated permease PerM
VGIVAWAAVGIAVLVYLFARFVLYPIRIIFPPLILAFVLVYLLNPVVSLLERRGMKRLWASVLAYLTFLAAVAVGLAFLIPVISHQAVEFTRSLPRFLDKAQQDLADLARKLGFSVKGHDLFASFRPKGAVANYVGRVTSMGVGALRAVVTILLGIVLAFYILVDLPKIRSGMKGAVPARRRAELQELGNKLSTAVGGYFRGQLLVAIFVAAASMLGLYAVGLPYWAPVGLVAGLFNLVPLIGPFVGAIPALFIAFTTPASNSGVLLHLHPGWPLAVGASVALLVVQQVDNHLISPRLVTRTVKLHPLTVMLSLLAAGTVLGLWGMLLVIPVVASAKILMVHYWDTRMVWPPPGTESQAVTPADAPAAEAASAARPRAGQPAPRKVPAAPGPPGNGGSAGEGRGMRWRERLRSPFSGRGARTRGRS